MAVWLVIAGLATAFGYLWVIEHKASVMRSVLKTVPVMLFSAAGLLWSAPTFLVAGLMLSAVGDCALSRDGKPAFLYGLAAFALAHVCYVILFSATSARPLWEAFATQPLLALTMVALALSTEIWLTPFTGNMAWPVRGYIALITTMTLAALTLPAGWAVYGAASFVLSDLILSLRLFRLKDGAAASRPAAIAVWGFYVAGQALILLGISGA